MDRHTDGLTFGLPGLLSQPKIFSSLDLVGVSTTARFHRYATLLLRDCFRGWQISGSSPLTSSTPSSSPTESSLMVSRCWRLSRRYSLTLTLPPALSAPVDPWMIMRKQWQEPEVCCTVYTWRERVGGSARAADTALDLSMLWWVSADKEVTIHPPGESVLPAQLVDTTGD